MDEKMNAYIVVFMTKPEMNSYSTLHKTLLAISKSFTSRPLSWCTSSFTHLIVTSDSINDLWRKFFTDNESAFGQEDHLYAISVCKPFHGYGKPKLRPWFEENIPDNEDGETWEDHLS